MSRSRTVALTALAPVAWGTTYLVTTEFLPPGRPLFAAAARSLPVGVVLVLRTRRLPRGEWWWKAGVLGALNIGAFFPLLFVAAYRLPGGVAATSVALQPLVAAGVAAVVIREPITRRTVLGALTGLFGVALLALQPGARLDAIGLLAAGAATASMSTGVVLAKHWGRPVDITTFAGWQLLVGGSLISATAVLVEGAPPRVDGTQLAGLSWIALVTTGLAYTVWMRGVQALPIATTSMLTLISPVVASVLGWWVLDQVLSPVQLLGAALVAGAVAGPQLRRQSASGRSGDAVPTATPLDPPPVCAGR